MKPNDPLFAKKTETINGDFFDYGVTSNLTVRDHVAIEMMKGLLSSGAWVPKRAESAYRIADDLIAESQK